MPCPFTGPKIFWASPKIWLHLVLLQKLLCRHKNQFYWMQIIFLSGTKCLWLPQNENKFLVWHKKFGPALIILGPVKGPGINLNWFKCYDTKCKYLHSFSLRFCKKKSFAFFTFLFFLCILGDIFCTNLRFIFVKHLKMNHIFHSSTAQYCMTLFSFKYCSPDNMYYPVLVQVSLT